jgi:hypothetical protein
MIKCEQVQLIQYVKVRKHQADLIQHEDGICRCIPAGTHGSTPHLLKTLIVIGSKRW